METRSAQNPTLRELTHLLKQTALGPIAFLEANRGHQAKCRCRQDLNKLALMLDHERWLAHPVLASGIIGFPRPRHLLRECPARCVLVQLHPRKRRVRKRGIVVHVQGRDESPHWIRIELNRITIKSDSDRGGIQHYGVRLFCFRPLAPRAKLDAVSNGLSGRAVADLEIPPVSLFRSYCSMIS